MWKPENFISEAIQRHHDKAVSLSDDLFANPEISNQEFLSSQKIVALLRDAGYKVEYPFAGRETAFCGVIDHGEGPSAAIMVEYDALPGLGHACGHNAHGAMSVLAALALADIKEDFPGKLYVIGTPAEEDNGAKVSMAKQGIFDEMSAAMMIHCTCGGIDYSDMDVLSLRCYLVEFTGVSAHAAAGPWEGHSALAAARKFLDLIDARRECFTPDIRVNGIITDGGKQPNIIPDRAEIRIEFRADSRKKLQSIEDMIKKCAHGAALALDCDVHFTEGFEGFDDMVRVPALEDAVVEILTGMGDECIPSPPPKGSSDVGNVSYCCPTIQPRISICDELYAPHTAEFRDATITPSAHQAIAKGGELIASIIYRVLTDDDFRMNVHDSYVASRDKKSYS